MFEAYCAACKKKSEYYASRYSETDPPCEACGGARRRCISQVHAVWTKNIEQYGDPHKETYYKDQKNGGHWVYRKNSGRALETGIPEPVFITSVSQQRRYCRDEGLIPPDDVGSAAFTVKSDGESVETAQGEPGCWV